LPMQPRLPDLPTIQTFLTSMIYSANKTFIKKTADNSVCGFLKCIDRNIRIVLSIG
jgi:hypothetical protein